MKHALILLLATLSLTACGSDSPYKQSKNDVMDSKNAYKECLDDHDGNSSKCEASRVSYEADMATMKALDGRE